MATAAARVDQNDPWIVFSATFFYVVGFMKVFWGFVAILKDDVVFFAEDGAVVWSVTTWGWITLLVGILLLVAASSLVAGSTWARVVGLLFAILGFIDAFLIFPIYPFWALFEMIVLGAVIYGLSARWPEAAYR